MSEDKFFLKRDEFKKVQILESSLNFTNEDLEIIKQIGHIDEGFLLDIKNMGLWQSLKKLGTKSMLNVFNFIKDNDQVKQAVKDAYMKGGETIGNDIGIIMSGYEDKLKKAQAEYDKQVEELKKKDEEKAKEIERLKKEAH